MGVNKKGGLVGGFDQLRAPDAPTISVSAGDASVTVTITNPSDTGGGNITSYAVSALTGPIEDTTFAVTVVSDGGNKYAIDGTTQATLTLYKGHTYIFDQSDSSNSGHPLRLSTTSNGTHGGGSEYTTGVTTSGTPGSAGAFTKIAIATDAPSTLYYYCSSHSGMGGTANLKASLQGGASGSSSPITVSSLTNGEDYNVRASAINVFGQSPYSAASTGSPVDPLAGNVAVFAGGERAPGSSSTRTNEIQFINFSSAGNASDFGDLSAEKEAMGAVASATRAVFGGGNTGSRINVMEYITMSTKSNTTDFGDLDADLQMVAGNSNSTRGIFYGGQNSSSVSTGSVQYITIASTGNTTNFGNLTVNRHHGSALSSTTRGVFAGGYASSFGSLFNVIDYVTIASTGNSTDFGDLSQVKRTMGPASSNTRGLFAGGGRNGSPFFLAEIDYITIASTGNASDFGDLSAGIRDELAGSSNKTKGVFAGGRDITDGGYLQKNVIEQVTIASTANSTDWGDLTQALGDLTGTGNAHGGLS